ncbi:MAG TPA: hypothetical protein PL045_00655 [Chitinophagaceae bacterium]|nr:hypothetical protein [Chitinophagaceae bacterium]
MIWIILIVVVLVIIIAAGSNKEKQNKILEERGFDISKKIDTGKYIAGHPDLDKTLKLTFILSKENELLIFEYPDGFISNMPRSVATISFSKIKDVIAEDASTIEKKVTVARMLAVGLFAFALKKKS